MWEIIDPCYSVAGKTSSGGTVVSLEEQEINQFIKGHPGLWMGLEGMIYKEKLRGLRKRWKFA